MGKITEFLKKLSTKTTHVVDPQQFNDPLAIRVSWSPAKGGGASFKTHSLIKAEYYRIEFIASLGAKIFYGLFFGIGLAVMIGVSIGMADEGIKVLFPIVFGGIFTTVGGLLYYFGTAPIVFDRQIGYYWKGRVKPTPYSSENPEKNCTQLGQIHALQLISEYVRSDKSSYYSYELNLVLKDGSRLNVVDHGKAEQLIEDAHVLADFLRVPLWNGM